MLMIWYEVMGDDLVYTYSNAQFQKQAQWSSHRNATIGSATHFYRLLQYFISNSSMIIDNIDAAEGLESERNYIKGQAIFTGLSPISRWYRCMAAVIRQRAITRNWVW